MCHLENCHLSQVNDLTHLGNAYYFSFETCQNRMDRECGSEGRPGAHQTLYELLIPAPTSILEILSTSSDVPVSVEQPALQEKEKSCFSAFANSYGIKSSTVSDFKRPTGHH